MAGFMRKVRIAVLNGDLLRINSGYGAVGKAGSYGHIERCTASALAALSLGIALRQLQPIKSFQKRAHLLLQRRNTTGYIALYVDRNLRVVQ